MTPWTEAGPSPPFGRRGAHGSYHGPDGLEGPADKLTQAIAPPLVCSEGGDTTPRTDSSASLLAMRRPFELRRISVV